jgi:alpha-1,2-glucosyltransferase
MVHLSQLVYFMSFCGLPLLVCCIDSLSNLQQRVIKYLSIKYISTYLIMVVFCLGSLQYFRYVHPFLLADNRHYTFYLISKGARIHEWIYLLVAPLHALLATAFASTLISARGSLWFTLYIACTALVLVPTPLVELRYFTVPFLIAYVNMDLNNNLHYYLVVYTFAVVNITTLYVFLYQPFTAPDGTVGRFMW